MIGGIPGPPENDLAPHLESRRQVTVLFADVVGSTPMAEGRDTEVVHRIMAKFFEAAAQVLVRHGGRVREYIGDEVFATFGNPDVHEDDALRAVRAADELLETLNARNDELERTEGVRLAVRIGINTGEVLTGNVSGGFEVLLGDAVNIAQRLATVGPTGGIVLGPGSWPLVRDKVWADPLGPVEVRGRNEHVEAWLLVAVADRDAAGVGGPGGASPLVGRHAQIETLQDAYTRTVLEQRGRILQILGEPGIGKSRLLRAFVGRIEHECSVVSAAGRPDTDDALATLRALASSAAGPDRIDVDDIVAHEPDDIRRTLEDRVHALLAGRAILVDEAVWATRRVLAGLAARGPLVVAVDDAHWAPDALLAVIDDLIAPGSAILAVLTSREDLLLRDDAPLPPADTQTIVLPPLEQHDRATLLLTTAGEALPPARAMAIAERSGGNPLFLLELVRAALEGEDDHAMPPTVNGVLAARIARLPVPEQETLRRCAIIGPSIARDELAALGEEEPDAAAAPLAERGFLEPAADADWTFHHGLVREAAYAATPKQERVELHDRLARWLIARDDPDGDTAGDTEARAGLHMAEVSDLLRELASDEPRAQQSALRAGKLLAVAGFKADAGPSDAPRALSLFRRAEQLLPPDEPIRRTIQPGLGRALALTSDLPGSMAVLRPAVELAMEAGDAAAEIRARYELVMHHQFARTPEWRQELAARLPSITATLERDHDEEALAKASMMATFEAWWRGRADEAERWQREAIRHARAAGFDHLHAEYLAGLALVWIAGMTPVDQTLARCGTIRNRLDASLRAQAVFAGSVPTVFAMTGDAERTDAALAFGRRRILALGQDAIVEIILTEAEILSLTMLGRFARARDASERLIDWYGHDQHGEADPQIYLADICWRSGELDRCADLLANVEARADLSDPAEGGLVRSLRAAITAESGDLEGATAQAFEALALLDATDMDGHLLDARLRVAQTLMMAGELATAADVVTTARDRARRKGVVPVLARADRVLAKIGG